MIVLPFTMPEPDEDAALCEDGAEPQALLLDFSDKEWQAEIDRVLDGWAEPRKAA